MLVSHALHSCGVDVKYMNMTDGSACRLDICSKQIGLQWLINGLCSTVIRHTAPLLGSSHFSIITTSNPSPLPPFTRHIHTHASMSLNASRHRHTRTHTERDMIGGQSEKYQTIQAAAGWRPHRDRIPPPPICSHFIETVGKLRGTHSPLWQDFDPQPAGEHVAAKVVPHPSSLHTDTHIETHTHTHTPATSSLGTISALFFSFFFLLLTPHLSAAFPLKYFELQHGYPQYIILLNINFCVCCLQPPRTPSPM